MQMERSFSIDSNSNVSGFRSRRQVDRPFSWRIFRCPYLVEVLPIQAGPDCQSLGSLVELAGKSVLQPDVRDLRVFRQPNRDRRIRRIVGGMENEIKPT